jgi:cell wall-associated NlpC family hydrolase
VSTDLTKYLKIPYVFGGYDWSGADCYGLVYLYCKHELGIEIPKITGLMRDGNYSPKLEDFCNDWFEVKLHEARKDDVVLFRGSCMLHVGIMINDKLVMHSAMHKGTSTIALSKVSGILGVYRRMGG